MAQSYFGSRSYGSEFGTLNELSTAVEERLADANEATARVMLEALKEIIQHNVYDFYEPINYDRTYQFRDKWDVKQDNAFGDSVSRIFFDWQSLTINRRLRQHTMSNLENLPIVIETGKGYTSGNVPDRPFWNEFLEYVRYHWTKEFKSQCKRLDLPLE